jgi:glucose-6-phosphate 1-dehydrogenase
MASVPTTIVIFGASGDLTARKLIPSLYRLDRKSRLPAEVQIVGVSRSPFTDDAFREKMAKALQQFSKSDWDADAWNRFAARLSYVPGDGATPDGLHALRDRLAKMEGDSAASARRIYYLSVGPDLYESFITHLGELKMTEEPSPGAYRRLIIEKPFGTDLASARDLNAKLRRYFREDQTYRIDHYLGKDTVQNILVMRFANTIFEPLWNSNYIDHLQITVAEDVAVGSRGGFYDGAGVLRDMFQNHLLQLLTLVAMEAPARFAADPLRNEKLKVLDAIPVLTPEEAKERVCVAQYTGYRQEKGVPPNSRTPTFAALELAIDNWRWRGVPFYLRSGKALNHRLSEIVIQFRCPPHLMFPLPRGQTLQCNQMSIRVQPDEGIHVSIQTKVPGFTGVDGNTDTRMQLRPADLEFNYKEAYPNLPIPEAYERLLLDVLHGDAALFMRSDEIERAWEIMDPIIAATEQGSGSLPEYAPGSAGPKCADEFLARTGRKWVSLCHV